MSAKREPPAGPSLARFDNSWWDPGRPLPVRLLWLVVSRLLVQTRMPWPSSLKAAVLRAFGARLGRRPVIRPRVTVKAPWHLEAGDDCWIGEGVWIDCLTTVRLGSDVCLSQGTMIETGNHDWSDPAFGLILTPVTVDDGAWTGVRSLLLPGAHLARGAVLAGGTVLAGATEPWGVYSGNPARRVRERRLDEAPRKGASGGPEEPD